MVSVEYRQWFRWCPYHSIEQGGWAFPRSSSIEITGKVRLPAVHVGLQEPSTERCQTPSGQQRMC